MTVPKEVVDLIQEQLRSAQAQLTVIQTESQETKLVLSTSIATIKEQIAHLIQSLSHIDEHIKDTKKHANAIAVAMITAAASIITSMIALLSK